MTDTSDQSRAARGGLRERKKNATRHALGQAALRLAVEHGLDKVLVEDIAAEVGVSPRTFNNYFSSKYEAICALGVDRAERVRSSLRARPPSEPLWEAITAAVLEHYDDSDDVPDRDWMAAMQLVMTAPALRGEYLKVNARMQQALADAIADRAGMDAERDMLPHILAGAVTASSQVAVRRWFAAEPPQPLRPLLQLALRQLASAFTPS